MGNATNISFSGILGHDIFVDENGEVEFNYTVLEKRGESNLRFI